MIRLNELMARSKSVDNICDVHIQLNVTATYFVHPIKQIGILMIYLNYIITFHNFPCFAVYFPKQLHNFVAHILPKAKIDHT